MTLETFTTDVLPLKNKLHRFATRFLGDEVEAQDVVQEVLIKVWNRREDVNKVENLEAWCMTVTRNLSLDKLKSSKRKNTVQMPEGLDVSEGDKRTPYHSAATGDMMKNIDGLMNALPEKQRQVMQLRDIEGFSYKEISDILILDLNQVKVNLFRARKFIREKLFEMNAYGLR
jgi:RNA polymerase sigma-70 factor (ECF subfamily)